MALDHYILHIRVEAVVAEGARKRGDLAKLVQMKRKLTRSKLMPEAGGDRFGDRLLKVLEAVPVEGYTCACCGYRGLVNVRVASDGAVVGPECVAHYPQKKCRM